MKSTTESRIAKVYEIYYKLTNIPCNWMQYNDFEYYDNEVENKLRNLRKFSKREMNGMKFRKKFIRFENVVTLTTKH